MYTIVELEDLRPKDKAIIVIDGKPRVVTVKESLPDSSCFLVEEFDMEVYLQEVAILNEE